MADRSPVPEVDYVLSIERRVNPKLKAAPIRFNNEQEFSSTVTTVTLDEGQWAVVQAAIVAALKPMRTITTEGA